MGLMKVDFDYTLKDGRIVRCYATLNSPEPDVGINGWWVDGLTVEDENSNQIELDNDEDQAVCDKASQIAEDSFWDEDNYL